MVETLLSVRDLSVSFRIDQGWVPAVDDVSFSLAPHEALGIVGESGSGKSVTALSLLRLHDERSTRITGQIIYRGTDLLSLSRSRLQKLRGSEIAMVFQDPQSALNPVMTVGDQIAEALIVHGTGKRAAQVRALELLEQVGIPDAKRRIGEYPHQFSGGMRQRVVIAIALASSPKLLIADEPTTALDVTIQAQILRLLGRLKDELGVAVLMITHDMGVVAETCDDVVVMYGGRVVERGRVDRGVDGRFQCLGGAGHRARSIAHLAPRYAPQYVPALSSTEWPRFGISMVRSKLMNSLPSCLMPRVRMRTMPWVGRDFDSRFSSTSDSA
jgi:peptide/nickel transport system ATP-binding protein